MLPARFIVARVPFILLSFVPIRQGSLSFVPMRLCYSRMGCVCPTLSVCSGCLHPTRIVPEPNSRKERNRTF